MADNNATPQERVKLHFCLTGCKDEDCKNFYTMTPRQRQAHEKKKKEDKNKKDKLEAESKAKSEAERKEHEAESERLKAEERARIAKWYADLKLDRDERLTKFKAKIEGLAVSLNLGRQSDNKGNTIFSKIDDNDI